MDSDLALVATLLPAGDDDVLVFPLECWGSEDDVVATLAGFKERWVAQVPVAIADAVEKNCGAVLVREDIDYVLVMKAEWDEELHPRGPDGRFASVRVDRMSELRSSGRLKGGTTDREEAIAEHRKVNRDREAPHVMVREKPDQQVDYFDPLTRRWTSVAQWNEGQYKPQIMEAKLADARRAYREAMEEHGYNQLTLESPQEELDRANEVMAPFNAAQQALSSQILDAKFRGHETQIAFGLEESHLEQGDVPARGVRTLQQRDVEIAALPKIDSRYLEASQNEIAAYRQRSREVGMSIEPEMVPAIRFVTDDENSWMIRAVQINSEKAQAFSPELRATIEKHTQALYDATAIAEALAPAEPTTLYRGLALIDGEKDHAELLDSLLDVGQQIDMQSFASWSASPEVAKDFSYGRQGKVKMLHDLAVQGQPDGILRENQQFRRVVFVTKTTKGLPVTKFSRFDHEAETILPPSTYRVTGLRRATDSHRDILLVDLEKVDRIPTQKADWDESLHPRDDHGRFGSGGGASPGGAEAIAVPKMTRADIDSASKAAPRLSDADLRARKMDSPLHRRHAEMVDEELSDADRKSMKHWSSEGYTAIRAVLSGEPVPPGFTKKTAEENAKALTDNVAAAEAITKAANLPEKRLYRGMALPRGETELMSQLMTPGATVSLKGPSSWSANPLVAKTFAKAGQTRVRPVILYVRSRAGLSMPASIKPKYAYEMETVMLPVSYRVVKHEMLQEANGKDSALFVTLEEINEGISKADWDESRHPRDPNGRFGSGGGHSASAAEKKAYQGKVGKARYDVGPAVDDKLGLPGFSAALCDAWSNNLQSGIGGEISEAALRTGLAHGPPLERAGVDIYSMDDTRATVPFIEPLVIEATVGSGTAKFKVMDGNVYPARTRVLNESKKVASVDDWVLQTHAATQVALEAHGLPALMRGVRGELAEKLLATGSGFEYDDRALASYTAEPAMARSYAGPDGLIVRYENAAPKDVLFTSQTHRNVGISEHVMLGQRMRVTRITEEEFADRDGTWRSKVAYVSSTADVSKADASLRVAAAALGVVGDETYVIDGDFWRPDDDVAATIEGLEGSWFADISGLGMDDVIEITKRAGTVLSSPLAPGGVFATSEVVAPGPDVCVLSGQESFPEQALVMKSMEHVRIAKTGEERYVLGVVLEPDTVDSQGDFYSAEDVRKAAHSYMEHHTQLGLQHREIVTGKLKILESFVAPADFQIEDQTVRQGTWLMGIRVVDEGLWAQTKKGAFTGFSIGGSAYRKPEVYRAAPKVELEKEFDEGLHPRDDHGRFASGVGGGQAAAIDVPPKQGTAPQKTPKELARIRRQAAASRKKILESQLKHRKLRAEKPPPPERPRVPIPTPATPLKPLAEMLPKDPASSQRKLMAGLQRLDQDGGSMLRTQLRRVLEGMEMQPAGEYPTVAQAGANKLNVTPGVEIMSSAGVPALGVHSWDGSVHVASKVMDGAKAALEMAAQGRAPQFEDRQSLGVLIHEELHGFGPSRPDNYRGYGAVIEELTTEVIARAVTSKVTGFAVHRSSGGSYQTWIMGMMHSVYAGAEGRLDEEQIMGTIERASVAYKRLGDMGGTPLEEVFVRQLELPTAQQDAVLENFRKHIQPQP